MSEFVFATAQYESGDWDSAPMVPANIIDSVARYTDIPVAPTGRIVPFRIDEVLRYPLLFMTRHLPVRFTAQERRTAGPILSGGAFLSSTNPPPMSTGWFPRTRAEEIAPPGGAAYAFAKKTFGLNRQF